MEDFEWNKQREASRGNREWKGEREVAKIVSILLILPQLVEIEMAEDAVQIITLSCLPGKYLLLSIKKKKKQIESKVYERKENDWKMQPLLRKTSGSTALFTSLHIFYDRHLLKTPFHLFLLSLPPFFYTSAPVCPAPSWPMFHQLLDISL